MALVDLMRVGLENLRNEVDLLHEEMERTRKDFLQAQRAYQDKEEYLEIQERAVNAFVDKEEGPVISIKDVAELVNNNEKIKAIKLLRERKMNLSDSKRIVEIIAQL
jgi:hypothetical protein